MSNIATYWQGPSLCALCACTTNKSPIAQKSPIGWTIMGEMCLGNTHLNESVNVYKTFVMPNGQTSLLKPCENKFTVKEQLSFNKIEKNAIPSSEFDNEDRLFLQKMDKELPKL
jgi:hypothetical protein